jgi:hypothetical protein
LRQANALQHPFGKCFQLHVGLLPQANQCQQIGNGGQPRLFAHAIETAVDMQKFNSSQPFMKAEMFW